MKPNVGSVDRILRTVLAIVLAALYFTNTVGGTAGLVLLILGIFFAFTAVFSFCPLYRIVGLSTTGAKKKA